MAKVLVTYYTQSGNTGKMAQAVAEGARAAGAEVVVRPVEEVRPDSLLEYDGIIIGSPVYYGTMAAEVKRFIDESVAHHGELTGKVGGAFATCGVAGGGSETTVLDILHALLIHGMVIQGDAGGPHYGPVCVDAPDGTACTECEKLGARVATLAKRLAG